VRETTMNTASQHRSVSLAVWTLQFVEGNGMEEVVGSIPTRSTKSLNCLAPVILVGETGFGPPDPGPARRLTHFVMGAPEWVPK
jgi:hypothetical protein